MYGEIADTFDAIGARTDVHCAIFTGAGTGVLRRPDPRNYGGHTRQIRDAPRSARTFRRCATAPFR